MKNLYGIKAEWGRKLNFCKQNSHFQNSENICDSGTFFVETCSLRKMTSVGLRTEDRLDGAAKFVSWKARILLVLRENELWEEVVRNTTANPIVIPASIDAVAFAAFNKKDIKARRIILDAVKDYVIQHILGKDRAHEMWSALTGLF